MHIHICIYIYIYIYMFTSSWCSLSCFATCILHYRVREIYMIEFVKFLSSTHPIIVQCFLHPFLRRSNVHSAL